MTKINNIQYVNYTGKDIKFVRDLNLPDIPADKIPDGVDGKWVVKEFLPVRSSKVGDLIDDEVLYPYQLPDIQEDVYYILPESEAAEFGRKDVIYPVYALDEDESNKVCHLVRPFTAYEPD